MTAWKGNERIGKNGAGRRSGGRDARRADAGRVRDGLQRDLRGDAGQARGQLPGGIRRTPSTSRRRRSTAPSPERAPRSPAPTSSRSSPPPTCGRGEPVLDQLRLDGAEAGREVRQLQHGLPHRGPRAADALPDRAHRRVVGMGRAPQGQGAVGQGTRQADLGPEDQGQHAASRPSRRTPSSARTPARRQTSRPTPGPTPPGDGEVVDGWTYTVAAGQGISASGRRTASSSG